MFLLMTRAMTGLTGTEATTGLTGTEATTDLQEEIMETQGRGKIMTPAEEVETFLMMILFMTEENLTAQTGGEDDKD